MATFSIYTRAWQFRSSLTPATVINTMKILSKFGRFRLSTPLVAFAAAFLLAWSVVTLAPEGVAAEVEGLRPLEHSDYDRWNTITRQALSPDGQWVLYVLQSGKLDSDATVMIRHLKSAREYSVVRGSGARFTFDSKFVIYRIEPDKQLIKQLKRKKTEPEQMPVATLEILNLDSGDHVTVERVKSFDIPEENGQWLAYHLFKPNDTDTVKETKSPITETYEVTPEGLRRPVKKVPLKKRAPAVADPSEQLPTNESTLSSKNKIRKSESEQKSRSSSSAAEKEAEGESDSADDQKEKDLGTTLVLRDLDTGIEWRFPGAVDYTFSKPGNVLAFATSLDDGKEDPDLPDDEATNR